MIVRLVTATVRTDRAGSFNALMRAQLAILREHPGLVYVKLARRVQGDLEEVVLYEEWRDTASLYGWAGPELTRPRLIPGAEDLVTDVSVTHYEALDIDPSFDQEEVRAPALDRSPSERERHGTRIGDSGRHGAPGQRPGSTSPMGVP